MWLSWNIHPYNPAFENCCTHLEHLSLDREGKRGVMLTQTESELFKIFKMIDLSHLKCKHFVLL